MIIVRSLFVSVFFTFCCYIAAQSDSKQRVFDVEKIRRNNITKATIVHHDKDTVYLYEEFHFKDGWIVQEINYSFNDITLNIYDKDNSIIEEIIYEFDKNLEDTTLFYRTEYLYKDSLLVSTIMQYYDSVGHVTSTYRQIMEYRDTLLSEHIWFRQHDTIYTFYKYDSLGRMTMSYGTNYVSKKERTEYLYDSENRLIKEIYYSPLELSYSVTEREYTGALLTKVINYPRRFSKMDYSKNPDKMSISVHQLEYYDTGLIKKWTCANDFGEQLLWTHEYSYE